MMNKYKTVLMITILVASFSSTIAMQQPGMGYGNNPQSKQQRKAQKQERKAQKHEMKAQRAQQSGNAQKAAKERAKAQKHRDKAHGY